MKKSVVVLLLLMISFASAVPLLEFQNEDIQAGETILATITTAGEFVKQIETEHIVFYEGRKQKPFEYDILYYNGTHYLYIYAAREGNFSVHVNDILYKEADELKSITIIKPFNVSNEIEIDEETNETISKILGIRPGVVYTPRSSSIKLINKGTAVLELEYGKEKLTLEPLAVEEIALSPDDKFSYFNISGYKDFSIPIIHPTAGAIFESPLVKSDLRASPDFLVAELLTDTKEEEIVQLFNFGEENISDLKTTSDISFVKIGKLEDMGGRGIQNLTINFDAEETGHFQGIVNVSYIYQGEENILEIPMSLFVLPEGTTEEEFEPLEETCESLGGEICKKGFLCEEDAEQRFTKNVELCCFGDCQSIEKDEDEGGYGWLIALIILAGLAGYGYYVYSKQKKVEVKKPEDKLKESSEKFQKRMAGKPEASRVRGSLTKS